MHSTLLFILLYLLLCRASESRHINYILETSHIVLALSNTVVIQQVKFAKHKNQISYLAVVEYERVTVYSTARKTFPVLNEKVTQELKFTNKFILPHKIHRTLHIKPAVQYQAVFLTSNLAKIRRPLGPLQPD